MKYISSLKAAEILGVSKRYVNIMCVNGDIPGAYKSGNRWMIPENSITAKVGTGNKPVRTFNTSGVCDLHKYYMVNLDSRLAQVKVLVDGGKYFTINRARQFGKTTLLHDLMDYLNHDYFVVSMVFQMQMTEAKFKSKTVFLWPLPRRL